MSEDGKPERKGGKSRPDLRILRGESGGAPPGSSGRLSQQQHDDIRRLLAEGDLSRSEIARVVGCVPGTVTKIAQKIGAARPTSRYRPNKAALTETAAAHHQRARENQRLLSARLSEDALKEAGLRDGLGVDIQARSNLSRSLQLLIRTIIDLEELEQKIRAGERTARAESDMDEWLEFMSGSQTG